MVNSWKKPNHNLHAFKLNLKKKEKKGKGNSSERELPHPQHRSWADIWIASLGEVNMETGAPHPIFS